MLLLTLKTDVKRGRKSPRSLESSLLLELSLKPFERKAIGVSGQPASLSYSRQRRQVDSLETRKILNRRMRLDLWSPGTDLFSER
jgi:hypothetical protein